MKYLGLAAVVAASFVAPASAATVVYNSAPAAGFLYGTGNDYTPANAAVLTGGVNGTDEIALRFHQTGQVAPASDGTGTYTFALGTTPISFDWSVDLARSTQATLGSTLITVSNVGTGQTVSYDPFFIGNDNYSNIGAGLYQNSARLNFGFLLGNTGFTPNVDSTYRVNLTSNGNSLTVFAQLGAGAPVPEPATWAMMIVGFGMVGAGLRKRSVRTTVRFA